MRIPHLVAACVALFSVVADDALAQSFPRRDRMQGGAPRDPSDASKRTPAAPQPPADPLAAIERELPSLKTDLKLAPGQLAPWDAFERDVRDVAEMGRSRRRHVMALGGAPGGPTAVALVKALAEDDRMRAEAMADLRSHLEALYGALDEGQRTMLDRRIAQSQTDPLGR
jgi:hypothetical protein